MHTKVEKAPEIKGCLKLTKICQNQLIKNIHLINDIGTTPYHLIKPILLRKSAPFLKAIEEKSPHVLGFTDEIWEFLVTKDFPSSSYKSMSEKIRRQGKSFKEVYDALYTEKLLHEDISREKLRQIQKNLYSEKQKNKVIPINHIIVQPSKKRHWTTTTRSLNGGSNNSVKSSLLHKAKLQNQARAKFFSPGTNQSIQVNMPRNPNTARQIQILPNKHIKSTAMNNPINKLNHTKISIGDLSKIRFSGKEYPSNNTSTSSRGAADQADTGYPQKKKVKLNQGLSIPMTKLPSQSQPQSLMKQNSTNPVTSPTKKSNVYIHTNRN